MIFKNAAFYGGRFQPPHPGHNRVFAIANSCSPFKVRICTSNKTGPNSPFSFEDKAIIWYRMFDRVIEYSSNPVFNPSELSHPNEPMLLFCGEKDEDRYKKSDHYIPLNDDCDDNNLLSAKDKKYYLPISNFNEDFYQGTYLRNNLKYNKDLFIEVYGKFDQVVYDLINERL